MSDVMPPEESLVHKFQRGDEQAFDRLVERCTARVYQLAYRMVGNGDDAQDLAQEAFVRAYHALPKFRGESAFTTWLYRIVVNVCNDELKRRKSRPPTMTDLQQDDDTPSVADTATTGDTAEDAVLRKERQQALQHAILQLPETFRTVLILYDVQGLSYQEIAEVTNSNIGTVKSRLNRARNMLRETLSASRELFGLSGSRSIIGP